MQNSLGWNSQTWKEDEYVQWQMFFFFEIIVRVTHDAEFQLKFFLVAGKTKHYRITSQRSLSNYENDEHPALVLFFYFPCISCLKIFFFGY